MQWLIFYSTALVKAMKLPPVSFIGNQYLVSYRLLQQQCGVQVIDAKILAALQQAQTMQLLESDPQTHTGAEEDEDATVNTGNKSSARFIL